MIDFVAKLRFFFSPTKFSLFFLGKKMHFNIYYNIYEERFFTEMTIYEKKTKKMSNYQVESFAVSIFYCIFVRMKKEE